MSPLGHSTTTNDVIPHISRLFPDVGVPMQLKTDGGPQFSSKRFSNFCKRWHVCHTMSSPHYPQSNGHAEASVKAVKNLIHKTTTDGNLDTDGFQRALLEWRNTPRADGQSPAQILYGRPLASFVFADHRAFSEDYQSKANEADKRRHTQKSKSGAHYNRSAHPLKELMIGNRVDVQDHRTKRWTRSGIVVAIGRHNDYYVKMPSGRIKICYD